MQTHLASTGKLGLPNGPSRKRGLIPAFAIIAVLSGCAALNPSVAAKPGVAFLLTVGGSATVNGSETRITFDHVRYDMRCPADAVCDYPEYPLSQRRGPNDASVVVVVSTKGSPSEARILNLTSPTNETTVNGLRIRLEELTPEPRRSNGYMPGHYLAQLVIEPT